MGSGEQVGSVMRFYIYSIKSIFRHLGAPRYLSRWFYFYSIKSIFRRLSRREAPQNNLPLFLRATW